MKGVDEPLVSEIKDPSYYRSVAGRTTRELGATQRLHTDCPCCGYRHAVDPRDAEQSLHNRFEQTFLRKVKDKLQAYFTETWGWKTHEREFWKPDYTAKGKNKSKGIHSDSIDMVYQASAGYGLYRAWYKAQKWGYRNWFAIGWFDRPTIGEMFICIPLGNLFNVLQGIMDDSPEFANRVGLARRNALKRDGADLSDVGRDDEVAPGRDDGGVEGFDPASAIRV